MEQPLNDKKKCNGTQLSAVMNHIKLTDKKKLVNGSMKPRHF